MRYFLTLTFCLCTLLDTLAQQTTNPLVFSTNVNTVGTPLIEININFGVASGVNINNEALGDLIYNIKSNGETLFKSPTVTKSFRVRQELTLTISGATKDEIENFVSNSMTAYIEFKNDIKVPFSDGSILNFTVEDIKEKSSGKIGLSPENRDMYFAAFGGEYAYANNYFHWGMTPKSESDLNKLELNADFSFHQSYGFNSNKGGEGKSLVFYAKGRVSTNSLDSLNFLYIYPVNFDISGKAEAQIMGRLGVEGNQTFTSGRGVFNFSYQKIIPNLIDLSYGNNRLRLKPILNIGSKIYKEFDNMRTGLNGSNEFSAQIYGNLYYNIPVFDIYSIILDTNAYYDFSDKVNPEQKLRFNYSIALGVELPKTPFKTLFKYKNGQVDVNNLSDSNLTIGLLADLESILSSHK